MREIKGERLFHLTGDENINTNIMYYFDIKDLENYDYIGTYIHKKIYVKKNHPAPRVKGRRKGIMKPSNFTTDPMNSIIKKYEYERVARNIMIILARTGDTFRKLSWEEYKTERLKDKNFSEIEKQCFDKVIDFCVSVEKAKTFSPVWNKAGQ